MRLPLGILVVFGGLLPSAKALLAGDARPNLLIVETDEHHYNTLGCYGGSIVKTKNIDWLASHGAIATSCYATTPVCSPSRSSLMSGRYPQYTPVITNNIPMDDHIITFAEILRRQGYATGYAGQWHLDGAGKPEWEPKRNFGFEDNRFMFNRGHWKKLADTPDGPAVASRNRQGKPDYGVDGATDKSFTTDWLTDKTIEFIRAHADQPFCYMLSIPDPHGPNTVRAPYDTMFSHVKVPFPASLNPSADQIPLWGPRNKAVNQAMLRRIMPPYYGMVQCIDDNIGRILDSLRELKILDHTIVVFTSDHGDLCGEHARLNKGVPYEGSARIPFVIYDPAKIPAGTRVHQALACIDFLPTVLSLMDTKTLGTEQGRDASALFRQQTPDDWNDIIFLRSTGKTGWVAAVTDRYKLVLSGNDEPWLFDLERDPNELRNFYADADCAVIVRRLTRELAAYCRDYDDPHADQPRVRAILKRAS